MSSDFNHNNFNQEIENNTVPPTNNNHCNNSSKKVKTIVIVIIAILVIILFRIFVVSKIISYLIHLPNTSYDRSDDTIDNNSLDNTNTESETDLKNNNYDNLYGNWLTSGGTYFVFNEDNTFYWYKEKNNLNDNYYKGDMEILNASEALDDLKISYTQMLETIIMSEGQVSIYNVFSLKLTPTYLISGGIDKTSTNIGQGAYFKLLFVIIDDTNAEAYNYTYEDKYYLAKE